MESPIDWKTEFLLVNSEGLHGGKQQADTQRIWLCF